MKEKPKEPVKVKRVEQRVEHKFEGADPNACERCGKPMGLHRTRRFKEAASDGH